MWMVYAVTAMLVWGLNYTLDEKILTYKISAITLITIQSVIGAIIFICIGLYRTSLKTDVQYILADTKLTWLIGASIIAFTVASWLIVKSIQAKDATIAGMIESAYPFFTILFTWALFQTSHVNTGVVAGGILIFIGISVVLYCAPA